MYDGLRVECVSKEDGGYYTDICTLRYGILLSRSFSNYVSALWEKSTRTAAWLVTRSYVASLTSIIRMVMLLLSLDLPDPQLVLQAGGYVIRSLERSQSFKTSRAITPEPNMVQYSSAVEMNTSIIFARLSCPSRC